LRLTCFATSTTLPLVPIIHKYNMASTELNGQQALDE
jgi:hypothetical protein